MIALKNIKINETENKVFCDLVVEDSETLVPVAYDLVTGEMEIKPLPKGYEWCSGHILKAKKTIKEMAKTREFPSHKTVMWY